jgi:hypothetical protein
VDHRLPDDAPYHGISFATPGAVVNPDHKQKFPGYVQRDGMGMEILRPTEDGRRAIRLRRFLHPKKNTTLVKDLAADDSRPGGRIGVEKLGSRLVVYVIGDEVEAPFVVSAGKAHRSSARDRDGTRETDEVLLVSEVGDYYIGWHLLTGPDDAEGMQALRTLLSSYKGKESGD